MAVKTEPAIIVIFGATGDLVHRKLMPSLYELYVAGQFHEDTIILGLGRRTEVTDDDFRADVNKSILESHDDDKDKIPDWCADRIFYQGMGKGTPTDFKKLRSRILQLEKKYDLPGNRIFYLALPPQAFGYVITMLGEAGLNSNLKDDAEVGWTRLVIEKPFGHDLASAEKLNALIHNSFKEEQVYRIDHYLGKETVQNLLAFRFGNSIFEAVWNREKIEKVEITVAEELGVESRADYYEKSGALRDMVQNHLTQLLALTAMEIPSAFTAADIRYEKTKVLRSIEAIPAGDVVMGQYVEGEIDGEGVRGYRKEKGVRRDSKTPTFVAIKLFIENWRWAGVPFYLKTGKRLKGRMSEIVVTFKCPPVSIFKGKENCNISPNALVIAIQPNEGFRISFEVKSPGTEITLHTEWMHFSYADAFGALPDAYHTLLLDVMRGDQSLFVSADETMASWSLYTPVLKQRHAIHPYPAGSWGPKEAQRLWEKN